MSDTSMPQRDVLILLQLNTVGDPRLADGFTKETVASMFRSDLMPKEVLVLQHDGREILSIPWPDGVTLDEALLKWAASVQNANSWQYGGTL